MSFNLSALCFGTHDSSACVFCWVVCFFFASVKNREDVSSQLSGPILILKLDWEPKTIEDMGHPKLYIL